MIKEIFEVSDMPRILAMVAGFFGTADKAKKYVIEIKEQKKKRSLDANAYFWVLAGKIAGKSCVPVKEVYRSYIKEIGDNCDTVCVLDGAVESFCRAWESHGLGWVAECFPSKLDGCTNVNCFYGSSTYDTKQMSRLIELAIEDCKQFGIEYMTPDELAKMIGAWEKDG